MREYKKEETALFFTGWALVFLAAILYLLYRLLPLPYEKLMIPCIFYSATGLYCPGCGGTRAVSALLHGKFLTSFICHPLVVCTAIMGGWFLLSQSIERLSRHRIKIGMKYRDFYIWAALGIVIINFIVKNILLLVWNIDLLQNITLFYSPIR